MTIIKDADASLSYAIDWTTHLRSGDSIVSSEWTISQSGSETPLVVSDSWTVGVRAYVRLTGGQYGDRAELINKIVTAAGDTERQRISLAVGPRYAEPAA